MDKLSDLPPNQGVKKTPEEIQILNQFFHEQQKGIQQPPVSTATDISSAPSPSTGGETNSQGITSKITNIDWKVIGITSLIFALLANPWVDDIFCKMPYCGENALSLFGMKIIIFMILIVIVNVFI